VRIEPFELREGVAIHRYRAAMSAGGPLGYLNEYARAAFATAWHALRLSRRRPFDVVHACNPPDLLLPAVLPLRLRGTRFIFDHHDLVPELFRARFGTRYRPLYAVAIALERLTFRLADVVIATNESFRRVAIERGHKRPEDVFVVRNGPDAERFRPAPADPGSRAGQHVIGYVGTMGPQDGVDHALRALARLAERRGDWHAVLAGDGDALPQLKTLAAELALEERVEFPGYLPMEQVIALLQSADVCLAPEPKNALNDHSTLIKVAEYMSVGRPIVSFDLMESRVTAGEAAVYATANDEAAFAAAIDELLDDPARRRAMGETGRARVVGSLSWSHSVEQLLAAYEHCLRGPR
jgi:glycosyltransferase involved in cell wall biosynthesis